MKIPFNRPYFTGEEKKFIGEAIMQGKISGNGLFTQKCQSLMEEKFGFHKCLLTTSCTDALEMTALLLNIREGDEVIVPSFTFVSTALAYAVRGARVVFADSLPTHPNIDPDSVRKRINSRTKAIVVMHYAGFPCQMNELTELAEEHNLMIIEDAAHSLGMTFNGIYLGNFGQMSAFSFHETKNIHCGEGGCLIVNSPDLVERAEILWEKGTNRVAFGRGEAASYEWKDLGSSFLPSEISAAFLYAQLLHFDEIQHARHSVRQKYISLLQPLAEKGNISLPETEPNAGFFYLLAGNREERDALLKYLNGQGIQSVFHYLPLHKSSFAVQTYGDSYLPEASRYADCIIRLPFFNELKDNEIEYCCEKISAFFS
ncbi:MAG TPA: dTDP-4-amino-4,6-dideoxygalactose transaminase [Bacteroidia bacterium]|nr:dTDP-4-amino-4,6-dideoxygalactose transaminase [Bacteroidia bacterium]HRS59478.1 dTDP-4-amino-4,6-dideoxygalactose transaminase [Bacteroidia bacterium]HRU67762.1 dTDP-4-amino-4,6-dideoxygalactose transaminase [Bacteroidia bacterium]